MNTSANARMMNIYENLKTQSEFVEEGVLLIENKNKSLWVNLLVHNSTIYLFDYHTGRVIKSLIIDDHFEHSNVMSEDLLLHLTWKNDINDDMYLQARDQAQKLRIGLNLMSCYGNAMHKPDECTENHIEPSYCAVPINDSHEDCTVSSMDKVDAENNNAHASCMASSMSKDDAANTIKRGTVRSLQSLLGNSIPIAPKPLYSPKKAIFLNTYPLNSEIDDNVQKPDFTFLDNDGTQTPPPEEPIPDYVESVKNNNADVYAEKVNEEEIFVETSGDYAPVVEAEHWYKPDFNRKESENYLKNKEDGFFIVRNRNGIDSSVFPYALSLAYNRNPVHIQIQKTRDGGLVFAPLKPGEKVFHTLEELIDHYIDNKFYFTYDGKRGHASLLR